MKIKRLRVTIEPFLANEHGSEVNVEVITEDKGVTQYQQVYPTEHLEDMFSRFMRDAECRIRELIKEPTNAKP